VASPGCAAPREHGAALFIGSLFAMLVLLGYYNFARFGDPLQTGRTVDPAAAG
jgi:hypothetical protein